MDLKLCPMFIVINKSTLAAKYVVINFLAAINAKRFVMRQVNVSHLKKNFLKMVAVKGVECKEHPASIDAWSHVIQ